MIVNNSLWDDGTHGSSGLGELQIQWHATNNTIENNIAYASTKGYILYDFTTSTPQPATLDYNVYYATTGANSSLWDWQGKSITRFAAYKTGSGKDTHSQFADPLYDNITTSPHNLDVASGSPATNAGTNLGANVVGVLDFAGNPRVNGSGLINVVAYEQ